jgi:hypothetical protein
MIKRGSTSERKIKHKTPLLWDKVLKMCVLIILLQKQT